MSSTPAHNIGDLLDQSTNLRTLAPAAVGSQVALMSIISVSGDEFSFDFEGGALKTRRRLLL